MRRTLLRRSAAFLTILGLMALPKLALAQGAEFVTGINPIALLPVTSAISTATTTTDAAISTQTTALIQALQLMSGQLTSNTQAQINGSGNIATTKDNREVQLAVERATVAAESQSSSGTSACNVITGALAGESMNAEMSAYNEQATEAQLAWMTGGSSINPSPTYNGRQAAVNALVSNHCSTSEVQADKDDGLCTTGSIQTTDGTGGAEQQVVPQDIMAGTALIASQNSVLSTQEQKALPDFMALAFTPFPLGALPAGAATTPSGKEAAYNRLVQEAQSSIQNGVFNSVAGRQTPLTSNVTGGTGTTSSSPTSLTSWANGTMSQIATGQPAPAGGWFPNGVSFDAWLQVRAEGWFMNPNWTGALNSYTETSAVKDLAMIESFRAYLQFLQYRDQEQTNLLLAQDTELLQELVDHQGSGN
jgi:hypothetical protein